MTLVKLPLSLPGHVYVSPMPFSDYDQYHDLIDLYQKNRVEVVVILAGAEETEQITGRDLPALYESLNMKVYPFPINDFGFPPLSKLDSVIDQVLAEAKSGTNLVIHCHVGRGRTGMFAACLGKRVLGLSGEQAIQWIRGVIPHAVETSEQARIVEQF